MPIIVKTVFAPAFNADIPVLSFRYNSWRVIINKREILVKDIAKEADAIEVVNYLKDIIDKADKTMEKAKGYGK